LRRDPEFRQTVAGYLGLAENTEKKLDQHLEELRSIRQETAEKHGRNIEKAMAGGPRNSAKTRQKLWEEVRGLREDQEKAVGRKSES
jgi:hypothetical protein